MSENCLRKLTISLIACLLDGCLTYSNSVSKVSIVEFKIVLSVIINLLIK
jgi:hypothetical protein